ncbi:hypothetical protein I8751_03585 [Nostocaceae cyanobacterium CENA357]|uniref:Uncharacterized protein n=1 Tax=Atlanticothrix silvestris CENA357 TaxID=1725252 RepID=A0A8J7H7T2_9CYAN|nr:hypothetical protein [Atlanticothrix silvestris]MBH8551476.1 hypothetical protein [Atlanticothrix silvestris CENA357]
MSEVNFEGLKLSVLDLSSVPEIYLRELTVDECHQIQGGHIPGLPSPSEATPPPGFHRGGWSGWFKAQGIFPD